MGGGGERVLVVMKIWSVNQNKITTPLCTCNENLPSSSKHVKRNSPPSSSYFIIYTNSIVFHENRLFIKFVKSICQWGMKTIHSPLQGLKKHSPPWCLPQIQPQNKPDPVLLPVLNSHSRRSYNRLFIMVLPWTCAGDAITRA